MKRIAIAFGIVVLLGISIAMAYPKTFSIVSPIGSGPVIQKPLLRYTIEQLGNTTISPSQITLGDVSEETGSYTTRTFTYMSDGPTSPDGLRGVKKKVSGVAHVPTIPAPAKGFPVIVQFRGYVDPTVYTPGLGTSRSAEIFAKNGYISLAPDFLGYGSSDPLTNNVFLDRFETYTTALSLLASIHNFPNADSTRVGIWGHSNGGQIAITVLEILQQTIPTVLWAPVTKPFPYSILYYTDDSDDNGKFLRKELAAFEALYDVDKYSLTNYMSRLKGSIQLHQGGADESVPQQWNDAFASQLKKEGIDSSYFIYPQADHNLIPNWNTVVGRDIEFFKRYLR